MVPKLECRSEDYNNKCYTIAKTSLENTSRRPIYINNAYFLLTSSSLENDDGIKKLSMDVRIKELGDKRISPELYTKLYEACINDQCKEIRKIDGDITIIFKILPYYTSCILVWVVLHSIFRYSTRSTKARNMVNILWCYRQRLVP
jgi:hypothetical protein